MTWQISLDVREPTAVPASFDLSPLQRELLEAFFATDTDFFLSRATRS